MTPDQIPPKDEWKNLSASQLLDIKNLMLDRYYNMRTMHASFANQFLQFAHEVDALLARQEQIRQQELDQARQ